eukprot:CAMPEP_0115857188 /NCGR_PEP_ID=MMETSP0287-20121206/15445_1 /TAXON_ID=412157 /ORGANISM="Chrysochromulina rotalis, Strain UIO044" /LENGTH=66 /DNA_ID=CAMNT_0003311397 /DNA_START=232 /DNA_END=433 /DNA_ORIENTATION=+
MINEGVGGVRAAPLLCWPSRPTSLLALAAIAVPGSSPAATTRLLGIVSHPDTAAIRRHPKAMEAPA